MFFENTDFLEFPDIFSLKKTSENHLNSGKMEKNKTTFTQTTFKVVRVKVVLFF